MSDDEGFLGRWSRRKRGAEHPAPTPEPDAAPEADLPEPEPALSEEDLAALPRIEELTIGSDIRMFLRPGVPAALKNAALQRIWMLTPAIRDYRDPAVDYAWDWNTPGGVPGDGFAPSAERAAQMLRDLFTPKTAEPAAVAPSAPLDDSPDPPAADAPELPAVAQAEAEPSEITAELAKDTPNALPRPRHGGALPT